MGRPHKLTKARIQTMANAMASGVTKEIAARYGGLYRGTYYEYQALARSIIDEEREPETPHEKLCIEMYEALEEAALGAEVRLAADIAKASNNGDWRAGAHILARRHPERWADKSRVEISAGGYDGAQDAEATYVFGSISKFVKPPAEIEEAVIVEEGT